MIVKFPEPPGVCEAHTPSLSLATKLDTTAVHPITVGVPVTVVEAVDVPPVITLLVANIALGNLPKFTTILLDAVDTTVPVAATPVSSPELTTPVRVSPTLRLVPVPLVTATV